MEIFETQFDWLTTLSKGHGFGSQQCLRISTDRNSISMKEKSTIDLLQRSPFKEIVVKDDIQKKGGLISFILSDPTPDRPRT